LVDPRTWVTDPIPETVEIGTVVEIELNHNREWFLIAGARDNQVPDSGNILPLPYNSPLGKVLLGRKPEDRFVANVNAHENSVLIRQIRRPTSEEILRIFPALKEGA
jgi:transcription elongation GreA/GreB family factor